MKKNDFDLIVFLIILTTFLVVLYGITVGAKGPFYEKPLEIYFTEFDSKIFDNQSACFSFVLKGKAEANLTISLDDKIVLEKDKYIIDGEKKEKYCIESSFGKHVLEARAGKSLIKFQFIKENRTAEESRESLLNVSVNGKVKINFFNGESKEKVYFLEFGDQSSYLKINPLQEIEVVKEIPNNDANISAGNQTIFVKGTHKDKINFSFIFFGFIFFLLPGFILFYRKNIEGIAYALVFSLTSFCLLTMFLDLFTKVNFYTVFFSWLIVLGGCFAWKNICGRR